MKKMFKKLIIACMILLALTMLFISCSKPQKNNTCSSHDYFYVFDDDSHYLSCRICGNETPEEEHTLLFPSNEDDDFLCIDCGYTTDTIIYKRYGILESIETTENRTEIELFWDDETYRLDCINDISSVPIGSFIEVTIQIYDVIDYKVLVDHTIMNNNADSLTNYVCDDILSYMDFNSLDDITINNISSESKEYVAINFNFGKHIEVCYNDIYDMSTQEVIEVTDLVKNDIIIFYESNNYMYIIVI